MKRRDFLLTSAATLTALRWSPGLAGNAVAGGAVMIEDTVPESILFGTAFRADMRIECRLEHALALPATLHDVLNRYGTLSACTRESACFVIEQLLRGTEHRLEIIATHDYLAPAILRHTVRRRHAGTLATLASLASRNGADWPRALAASLNAPLESTRAAARTLDVPLRRPAASPGHLLTWRIV